MMGDLISIGITVIPNRPQKQKKTSVIKSIRGIREIFAREIALVLGLEGWIQFL